MSDLSQEKPITILLVEDNPADVRLTMEALKEGKILNTLHVVQDGEKAVQFLHRDSPYTAAPRPDLILLDLNLPRKNGREVLEEIKSHDSLKRIPVVILTTSRDDEDVVKSYDQHANCYITKPVDLAKFINIVRSIKDFWVNIVTLPPM